jgi:hypothetical protein
MNTYSQTLYKVKKTVAANDVTMNDCENGFEMK